MRAARVIWLRVYWFPCPFSVHRLPYSLLATTKKWKMLFLYHFWCDVLDWDSTSTHLRTWLIARNHWRSQVVRIYSHRASEKTKRNTSHMCNMYNSDTLIVESRPTSILYRKSSYQPLDSYRFTHASRLATSAYMHMHTHTQIVAFAVVSDANESYDNADNVIKFVNACKI